MIKFDEKNPFNDASKNGMLPDGCGIFERYYTSGQEVDLCGLSPNPDDYETPQTLYEKILELVKNIIVSVDLNTNGTYNPSDFDIYPLIANATSVKDAVERLSKYIEDLQQRKFDKLNLKLKYENGIVSLVFNDETYTSINIPEEQFLDYQETVFIPSATTEDWKTDSSVIIGKPYLRLAFKTIDANGSPTITYTYIPMNYLFNVYGVEDTNSIDMHIIPSGDTNVFSGDLRVNDVDSNALKVDALGVYVEDLNPVIKAENIRAEAAEKTLTDDLAKEVTRATNMEYNIINMVSNETDRAIEAEKKLQDQITTEVNRASGIEQQLYDKIQVEQTRAVNAEGDLRDDLNVEIQRSTNKDVQLDEKITDEITRATNRENELDVDIKARIQSVTGSNSINVTTDINKNVQIEAKIKSGDNKLNVDNDGMFVAPYDTELDSESTNAVENKVLYEAIKNLQDQLNALSKEYATYGFARINGAVSAEKLEDYSFGDEAIYEKILSHLNMGLVQNGKLYKRCANGRIDLAVDGTELYIDGSDGDVLLYTDTDLYFLKGTFNISGMELNLFALSLLPFEYQSKKAKKFAPFAYTPHYTVWDKLTKDNNIKGVEDVRICAHSVYNKNLVGSYTEAKPIFTEVFKPNGNGYWNNEVNYFDNVWMAQAKNADQTTNRPYMGAYYEFYEIICSLIFMGLGSLYTVRKDLFGGGMMQANRTLLNKESFFDNMYGTTLDLVEEPNGTKWFTTMSSNLYNPDIPSEIDGDIFSLNGLAGTSLYTVTEMLEPQRIFNDVTKYNLTEYVWDGVTMDSNKLKLLFEYNSDNELVVSDKTIDDIVNGTIQTNHKYFQIRNVPGFKGISNGLMTGVINIYIKMMANENIKIDLDGEATDFDGNKIIWGERVKNVKSLTYKLSHCVFKGYEMLGGAFYYAQGCYQEISNVDEGDGENHYHNKFISVSSVDRLPAYKTNFSQYFGDVNSLLPINEWSDIIVENDACFGGGSWKEKANYNASFFCVTERYKTGEFNTPSEGTYECTYTNNGNALGNEDEGVAINGLPRIGRKVITCAAFGGRGNTAASSLKNVDFSVAPTFRYYYFGGSFSIPYLKL